MNQKETTSPQSFSWILKMAWRDSRTYRKRLLLYMASIVLGVAALVAIRSFDFSLSDAINTQSKTLLGADLSVDTHQPFTKEQQAFIDSVGGEQSQQASFASMAYFPKSRSTRLAQIRALQGGFPYYGSFETVPSHADTLLKHGKYALVEESMMIQYGENVGDSVQVGDVTFKIAGSLKQVPGEAGAAAIIGPRIYIPLKYLHQTGLVQVGSRIEYKTFFYFKNKNRVESAVQSVQSVARENHWRVDTVQRRKARLGRVMDNLYRFLSLVGFIALLLGAIGVASSIHVYIRQKFSNIAILRCLGAKVKTTVSIYLVQAVTTGFIGALLGSLIGIFVQGILPQVLNDFLPFQISFTIFWPAVAEGMLTGLGFTLLFALLPLLSIRRISPLATLRYDFQAEPDDNRRDYLKWALYFIIILAITLFAISQTSRWQLGIGFTVALFIAFGLLAGVSRLLMFFIRKFFPKSWSFNWRQGLANLFRPQNQTTILMLSIGLGTFLIMTLYLTQNLLLKQVSMAGGKNQPNMVLFDIQKNQVNKVSDLIQSKKLEILQKVPIVTMRIASVKGRSVKSILADSNRHTPRWAYQHEYRVTYRDSLIDTEHLVRGTIQKKVTKAGEIPKISIEQEMARNLNVAIGDTIVFNVSGIPITTTVGSIRDVDWQRVQPNFFVVFPDGVLDNAPQFFVIVTRVPNDNISANLQRAVVQQFPNVSIIDLKLIITTIDNVLSKIAFAIRFMALFSIFTGLIVLSGSIVTSRYQRIKESVLLRTLGASRNQVLKIMSIEYLFLGLFAALTGVILAIFSSWSLFYFVFNSAFTFSPIPLILALFIVMILTLGIGLLNSRGIHTRPPLEILRSEA